MNTVLGEKIKELREQKGWSQAQLGKRAGVSRSMISKIEQNERGAGPALIENLARVLGVREFELLKAAGMDVLDENLLNANNATRDFYLWLYAKNPSEKDIKVIKAMAEAYLTENERVGGND